MTEKPMAWYVYIPSHQNAYAVIDEDDAQLIDDCTNTDAVVTPLYDHTDACGSGAGCLYKDALIESLEERLAATAQDPPQRLTEAGEMQAALERIADLKALLARARQSMYSFEPLALAVDTALAGKPERKAQDDGGYDLVAAWDRSGLLYPDDMVDPVFQAGWDAAKGTT